MIQFENWTLRVSGELARQFDHLSRRLEVTGDLPEGWRWEVLVQVGAAMDIIPLEEIPGGAGVDLTRDQLSVGDAYYHIQLRGTKGEQMRHTNVVQVFVPASLAGDGAWPTIPSEFSQLEERMRELSLHPPVPGENGFWLLWSVEQGRYEQSQFRLPNGGGGVDSVNGKTGAVTLTAEDVGALPLETPIPFVPTDVSAFANDAGYYQKPSGGIPAGDIANGAITSGKLGSGAVTEGKIGTGAVTTNKLGSGAVTTAKLADGAVTADKLASGVIPAAYNDSEVRSAIRDLQTALLGVSTLIGGEN